MRILARYPVSFRGVDKSSQSGVPTGVSGWTGLPCGTPQRGASFLGPRTVLKVGTLPLMKQLACPIGPQTSTLPPSTREDILISFEVIALAIVKGTNSHVHPLARPPHHKRPYWPAR